MIQTQPLAWGARVSPAFRARLFVLCADFDWPEERDSHLVAVTPRQPPAAPHGL